jgi:zinc transport system substrate-binding protein
MTSAIRGVVVLLSMVAPLLSSAAAAPLVVATIKPVHSLVAMVMQGVAEPHLLITSGASPHTYSLRPSDAQTLQQADLVFWVGEGLETFLVKPLRALPRKARIIALAEAPGVVLLPYRSSGLWEAHGPGSTDSSTPHAHDESHPDGDDDHEHRAADMHIWLDPANSQAMVHAAAAALSEVDPSHAETYRSNAEAALASLQALDDSLRQTLEPLAGRPYVVFHDAYHYLERRYGLTPVGSITVDPDRQPSAQRVAAIRRRIAETGAICVFSEPQFSPKLIPTLTEGTKARTGVLDADGGTTVPSGPDAYPAIMRNLAGALRECLDPSN